ncbi:MAG: PAS domain-containing protein, partial [Acidobacteriota bacterium]
MHLFKLMISLKEGQLISVIESITDFVATINIDGRLLYLNTAGREMLELSDKADLSTTKIYDFYPEWAGLLIMQEGIPTAVRDGLWQGETALLRPSGEEVAISQIILTHKSEDGTIAFLCTIAHYTDKGKTTEKSTHLLSRVFESTQEGIIITDAN